MPFDADKAAAFIDAEHRAKAVFRNMPEDVGPKTVSEAYAAQEALRAIWEPIHGLVAGLKIATTTKVMQQLMGIDHPCGGMIYEKRIHASPATVAKANYMNMVIECEMAVRLDRDLPPGGKPIDRDTVRQAVGEVMAAYELIEDRKAVYKESKALTLIADNAWNAGIVLGKAVKPPKSLELNGTAARVSVNGREVAAGKSDDPMGALAWVANLAADRGRPLKAGMVVITGSIVATFPVSAGDKLHFEIDGIGSADMTVTA